MTKNASYDCVHCNGKPRSKHNRKRHDALHSVCKICTAIRGPRHNCLRSRKLQWIGLIFDNQLCHYVLGIPLEKPVPVKVDQSAQVNSETCDKTDT